MKTIRIQQRTLILSCTILLVILSFSCRNASEKAAEKMIENAISGDADVDLKNDQLTIQSDQGSFTAGEVTSWPESIPSDVPEFTYGEIKTALTQSLPIGNNWNISFEGVKREDLDNFKKELENKGYKIIGTFEAANQSQLSAQKGVFTISAIVSEGTAALTIMENKQEE